MPSHVQPSPKQQRLLLPDAQAKPQQQLLKKAFLDG
jgi:hypothetical protein